MIKFRLYLFVFVVVLFLQNCSAEDAIFEGDRFCNTSNDSTIQRGLPIVPIKAFYKDVFLDSGIGLTSRKFLYAAQYLGLSTEGVSFPRSGATVEDSVLQNQILAGDEHDLNGRLLYPDGQPRYRLLFVNGGSSKTHGESLNKLAQNNMRLFVKNGGSYVGTCAGAFFASNGYDSNYDYPYYLSIWPYMMNHTGISDGVTGMFIEPNSPLLQYFDFGGDNYVSDIRHNKGGYPVEFSSDTEVLARYDYPAKPDVHMQPSIWSCKNDSVGGRIVMEGSHPEEVSSGERRDLTAAMMQYAMDGVGRTIIKGILNNGEVRFMDKGTEDNSPLYTKIGDLQCHHFIVEIPEDVHDITVTIESNVDCDLSLMMCHNTYAYPDEADYRSAKKGAYQQLSFSSLESGIWYVAVQCLSTVNVIETEYGQSYVDPYGVLNGIPYQIVVSWQEKNEEVSINPIKNKNKKDNTRNRSLIGMDGKVYKQPKSHHVYIQEVNSFTHKKKFIK